MDIGTKVSCQRCTTEFFMYYETHNIWTGCVGGMCPNCCTYVTARVRKEAIEFYPPHELYTKGQTITPVPYAGE